MPKIRGGGDIGRDSPKEIWELCYDLDFKEVYGELRKREEQRHRITVVAVD
jgi:hypothetical protein